MMPRLAALLPRTRWCPGLVSTVLVCGLSAVAEVGVLHASESAPCAHLEQGREAAIRVGASEEGAPPAQYCAFHREDLEDDIRKKDLSTSAYRMFQVEERGEYVGPDGRTHFVISTVPTVMLIATSPDGRQAFALRGSTDPTAGLNGLATFLGLEIDTEVKARAWLSFYLAHAVDESHHVVFDQARARCAVEVHVRAAYREKGVGAELAAWARRNRRGLRQVVPPAIRPAEAGGWHVEYCVASGSRILRRRLYMARDGSITPAGQDVLADVVRGLESAGHLAR